MQTNLCADVTIKFIFISEPANLQGTRQIIAGFSILYQKIITFFFGGGGQDDAPKPRRECWILFCTKTDTNSYLSSSFLLFCFFPLIFDRSSMTSSAGAWPLAIRSRSFSMSASLENKTK